MNREGEEKNWKGNGRQGEKKTIVVGRRRKPKQFFFFLNPAGLMKNIFCFYFCNCTFCAKSQIFFLMVS